jgi:hypothetical protein
MCFLAINQRSKSGNKTHAFKLEINLGSLYVLMEMFRHWMMS